MRMNVAQVPVHTHEGGVASRVSPLAELERTVLACLLWEDSFYESGQDVAARILDLVFKAADTDVQSLAVKARNEYRLRHAPLLMAAALARKRSKLTADTIAGVIQRADEMAEFLKLYWHLNGGKKPLAAQVKKGLARVFPRFDAYQLGKYNRDSEIKLRDVMFLVHPKPKDDAQEAVWRALVNGTLESPDTWEVALSGGSDKRETFTRLMTENKLGYMALLRNLRNMIDAKVDGVLIRSALLSGAAKSKALPFRFISAARAAPQLEDVLDQAMQLALNEAEKLPGLTVLLIDVSGSMFGSGAELSGKSTLTRADAACALAILARGIGDQVRVFTFSQGLAEVPPRQGMALADAVVISQPHGGTYLRGAGDAMHRNGVTYDRIIVFTDEQSADGVFQPLPGTKAYIVNVAAYKRGVGYGQWTRINGFSEGVIRYIQAVESAATT